MSRLLVVVYTASLAWLCTLYAVDGGDTIIKVAKANDQVAGSFKSYLCQLAVIVPLTVDVLLCKEKRTWDLVCLLNSLSFFIMALLLAFIGDSGMLAIMAANVMLLLTQFKPHKLLVSVLALFIVLTCIYEANGSGHGLAYEIITIFAAHATVIEIIAR